MLPLNPRNNRIFISIPWFCPAYKAGGPIQSVYNLIKHLGNRYHFYIFTSNEDLDGTRLSDVEVNTWINFDADTCVYYAPKKVRRIALLSQIKEIQPLKVFVIGLFNWSFNLVPILYSPVPVMVSVRGMLYTGALEQKQWKKKLFLFLFNLIRLNRRHVFHATDAQEELEIQKSLGKHTRIFIAGNFPRVLEFSSKKKGNGILELITVALVGPMKNHLKVLQGLQLLKFRVHYHVYGPVKDKPYWNECLAVIKQLPNNITFTYHGEVAPSFIPEALAGSDLFIMPSISENYGHAIIEALFAGLPVITSTNVPWIGLKNAKAGINTDAEPKPIARAIEQFAQMEDAEFAQWKTGARMYAIDHTDTDSITQAHIDMFEAK